MPAARASQRPSPWIGFLPGLFIGAVVAAMLLTLLVVRLSQ